MTTKVTADSLHEINAEHRALDRQYTTFQTLLDNGDTQLPTLRSRLSNLAAVLQCHFEHEEDGGYFTDIIEAAPHLDRQVRELEFEHEHLLARFQQIDERLSVPVNVAKAFATLKQDIRELVTACRAHERSENKLSQEVRRREFGEAE